MTDTKLIKTEVVFWRNLTNSDRKNLTVLANYFNEKQATTIVKKSLPELIRAIHENNDLKTEVQELRTKLKSLKHHFKTYTDSKEAFTEIINKLKL